MNSARAGKLVRRSREKFRLPREKISRRRKKFRLREELYGRAHRRMDRRRRNFGDCRNRIGRLGRRSSGNRETWPELSREYKLRSAPEADDWDDAARERLGQLSARAASAEFRRSRVDTEKNGEGNRA